MKPFIIIITGLTASSKSKLAVSLAKLINGEIVSADSVQVYKYMDIGTAKPTKREMDGIEHYMLSEIYPDQDFSAHKFKEMSRKYIKQIIDKGKIPIVVGGTGFYIDAVLKDFKTDYVVDKKLRASLSQELELKGKQHIFNDLKKIDINYANKIHINDEKRMLRALEYYHITGEQFSRYNAKISNIESVYNAYTVLLNPNRTELYSNINNRVETMFNKGFIDEVLALLKKGYTEGLVSMKSIGYKDVINYINGIMDLNSTKDKIKTDTRHLAKRQITWFKHKINSSVIIDPTESQKAFDKIRLIIDSYY